MAYETSQISFENKDLMYFLLLKLWQQRKSICKIFIPDLGALNSNMVLLKEWIGYWKAHYVK